MALSKITTGSLADAAITTDKIANSAINSAKIGVDVITAEDLAANSITVAEITNGAVTPAKLSTGGLYWDASSNVGIGTSSAGSRLDTRTSGSTVANFQSTAANGGYMTYVGGSTTYIGATLAFLGTGTASDFGIVGSGANNFIFGTSSAEKMRIDSSGNLLVGTTSVNGTEKFNVTSASTEVAFFQNSSNTSGYSGIRSNIGSGGSNTSTWHFRGETRGYASYYLYGNGTTSYSSDIRLKKNVQTARGYLEDLNKLRVVKYQWKGEDPDCQQVELGMIAQEVEEVFPNLIQEHEIEGVGNIKHIKQSVLPFMLLKAIQELKAENDALKARLDAANL